ncbi:S41 family peptidase [Chengkuizengella axinellae]|uniref:S41 family peptidase n=1 Tax=Chengkuizengella axinellae TaxID=3064388 RepID=A0ABT9J2X7_9BACL|nr:S41 family peptidase [Chengkuizengella sp. 2205SS18-9]MDP5275977.1 S41 family peptidase [Chengkuizengella sp. 2205SS18-9]
MKKGLFSMIVVFFIAGCSQEEIIMESMLTTEMWLEDIEEFAQRLPAKQVDFYSLIDEDDFYQKIELFKIDVPHLNDAQIKVRLNQIISSLGVAHTGMGGYFIDEKYPFDFYWFDEGIFVRNTTKEYEEALYTKLVKLNGIEINHVIKQVSSVISYENEYWLKKKIPSYLLIPEVLYGLGIIEDMNKKTSFSFENEEGEVLDLIVSKIDNPNFVIKNELNPLFYQNKDQNYWFEYLPKTKIVYIQYNQCMEMKEMPFDHFVKEVFDFMDNNETDKLVIDLRDNTGGDSSIFAPFFKAIEKHELNQKGKLYVLIGGRTFSSARINSMELKQYTNAILVGEPTGAKPNSYGESQVFKLKNSGILVQYSTKYFNMDKKDLDALYPDLEVPYTIEDFKNGIDPFLEMVINHVQK